DAEALEGVALLARTEGIIPALESAHAVAWVAKARDELAGRTVLINLSGRGDKDMGTIIEWMEGRLGSGPCSGRTTRSPRPTWPPGSPTRRSPRTSSPPWPTPAPTGSRSASRTPTR